MNVAPFTNWLRGQFEKTPNVRAKDIASDAAINEGYLSTLRSGRNTRPSRDKAEALAQTFAQLRGLSPEETQDLVAEAVRASTSSRSANQGPPVEKKTAPELDAKPSWEGVFASFLHETSSR